ncbi:MAG: folate family ECF transporter S component [Anaeroplasmataceae bacterium]
MKDYFRVLISKKIFILIFSVIIALSFFGLNFLISPEATSVYYSIDFKAENYDIIDIKKDDIDLVLIKIEEDREKNSYESNGEIKYPYSSFDYVNSKKMSKNGFFVKKTNDFYSIKVFKNYFNSLAQARRFLINYIYYQDVSKIDYETSKIKTKDEFVMFSSLHVNFDNVNQSYKDETSNKYIQNTSLFFIDISNTTYGYFSILYGFITGLLISLIFILVAFLYKKELIIDNCNYDGKKIFKHPFSLTFFKKALVELKIPKNLVIISILLALMQISKLIPIPSGFGNLGLSFSFIFFSIACLLYGPVAGILIGFLSDNLGFFIFPTGFPYHFGYTLNTMLVGLTYGLILYKTKVTFVKILFARAVISIGINALLGSLWMTQVMSINEGYLVYLLSYSLPKNIIYLIPQSLILFLLLKPLFRVFKQSNLISSEISNNLTII